MRAVGAVLAACCLVSLGLLTYYDRTPVHLEAPDVIAQIRKEKPCNPLPSFISNNSSHTTECYESKCEKEFKEMRYKCPKMDIQDLKHYCSSCCQSSGKSEFTTKMKAEILPGASKRKKPPFYYKDIATFVDYAENPRVSCPQRRYMGGRSRPSNEMDGHKAVCLAPVYNITPDDCIVYSFGISDDWSFDDAMAGYGCQVYSFDHTIGFESHNRSERVHFYNMGVGEMNKLIITADKNYTISSFGNIIDMLGHTNRIIDYVKLDIEASEILLLQALAEESHRLLQVKQFGIEVHPMDYLHTAVYEVFILLEYLGFTTFDARRPPVKALWYTKPSHPEQILSTCYEMAWAQVENIYW